MGEFGHHYASGPGFFIDSWGSGPFIIRVGERSYRFEDSDRFGPQLIKKDGYARANAIPGERSPFWRAHWLWRQQGRPVEPDGVTCIWREPKPTLYRRIGNANLIIQHGEPDMNGGTVIEVTEPFPLPGASHEE